MLISVFNRLKAEGVKVTLLIIGSGFESELGNELKSLANENIQFLGEKHYVADYLINADAFCLSSIHEGMPITLIEALACGCIPICTPVGGIVDTISDGVNGFISNSTTEEDYYNSIKKFINNPSLVKKDNLIKYYNERFTMFECADRHIKLYMEN
jgi:glycosyltransferase involved in cell wall biosynthesis